MAAYELLMYSTYCKVSGLTNYPFNKGLLIFLQQPWGWFLKVSESLGFGGSTSAFPAGVSLPFLYCLRRGMVELSVSATQLMRGC